MPRKPSHLTVYLASHRDPKLYHAINIDYYTSLEKTLDNLSYHQNRPRSLAQIPEQLYNKYNQLVPLDYQVSRTDLVFYIDQSPIPIEEWTNLTGNPPELPAEQLVEGGSEPECLLSDSE